MHMSESDQCPMCETSNVEVLEHYLLECPALSNIRCQFCNVFYASYYDQLLGINFIQLSSCAKLQFLVGDVGYAFNNDIGSFYDHYGKMYISKCFDTRNVLLCN